MADAQLGVPTGSTEIHTILEPQRDRPGRSGLLNNADQIVFRAVLSGGSEAVYLAEAD